jgi:hypothetical protein
MSNFSKFALIATPFIALCWVQAGPPGGSGGRPVVIAAPILDTDDDAPGEKRPPDGRALARAAQDRTGEAGIEADPTTLRSGADEMKRVRERLLRYATIQARIVETVAVFERSYKAEGRYLQTGLRANDWHMRLELVLKVGDSEGSLLEVCDGDVLWTSSQLDAGRKSAKKSEKDKKEHTITRRNVTRILAAARNVSEQAETGLIRELGLGGLPALLASIEREMTLGDVKEETLRDRPVLVIQATWTDEFLEKMRNPHAPRDSAVLLPPFVPDAARIHIDRETGFPLRITYLKKIPNRDVQRASVVLDFLDVELDQPIDKREFAYEPPTGEKVVELTQMFLDQLAPPGRSRSGSATRSP